MDHTDGLGMRLRLAWSHFHTLIVYVLHSMRGIYDDGYLVTSDLRPGLGHEE